MKGALNTITLTQINKKGRRDCDRMVFRFTTADAINAYITTKGVKLNPAHGEMYLIQHYVMKFVNPNPQVSSSLLLYKATPVMRHPSYQGQL